MNKYILICLLIALQNTSAQTNSGLAEEFLKLDNYLKNVKQSPEERKKILESNIINSVKTTLSHKFNDPKKELKDLKIQDIQSERKEGTNQLFIKYKNFYIAYTFYSDPEVYLASPVEEKVLEKPANADLNAAHEEKQSVIAK